jgi:flagellum-specific peptidoglycan hydrolase FlgJ
MNPKDFFDTYSSYAINEQIRSGVPASITLAQAALESGWGESALTKQANNFFGIKTGIGWTGETINFPTPDDPTPTSDFRKYSSPRESFHDHSLFLQNNHRYASLFNTDSYVNWADGLQLAGYGGTGYYGSTLIKMIEQYNLHQYDLQAVKKNV